MVVAAGEVAGIHTVDDPELSAFLADVQVQLLPYAATEWAQRFPHIFFGLGDTQQAVTVPWVLQPTPSRALLVPSANMSTF